MALTVAQFRVQFPEFADIVAYPDTLVDARQQQALRRISTTYFGVQGNDAHGNLTAHLLIHLAPGRSGGAQNVKAGTASVQYAMTTKALEQTAYGREYLYLVRINGGPILAN